MWPADLLNFLNSFISNPGVIAIATATITTMGVKIIEGRNKGRELKVDESTSLRIELREEIDKLRKMVEARDISIEKWSKDYFELMNKYNIAMNRARVAETDLKEALKEIQDLRPPGRE